MENVVTQKEVLIFIASVQEIIRRGDNRGSFGFAFEIDFLNKKFVLTTKSHYYFSASNKNGKFYEGKFYGSDVVAATNEFINFFNAGGKGQIRGEDKEGYKFNASFSLNTETNEWYVDFHRDSFSYHE